MYQDIPFCKHWGFIWLQFNLLVKSQNKTQTDVVAVSRATTFRVSGPPCMTSHVIFTIGLWSWGYYSDSKDGVRDSRRYKAEFELSPFHFKLVLCGFRTVVLKHQRQSCPIYWDICILAKFVIKCIFLKETLLCQ